MNGLPPIPPVPPSPVADLSDPRGSPIPRSDPVKAYEVPWRALVPDGGAAPASRAAPGTALELSPIGRLIAALLAENAAAPAVIRSPLALLRRGEPAESLPLQLRLRAAIEESGLFYESHLKRWYQKEYPYAQLRREPQMRLATAPAAGREGPVRGVLADERDLRSSELLRPLVRQQLELLSQPVLRWEGEFWNGIYMSLTLHFPAQEQPAAREGREEGEGDAEGDEPWQAELSLDLAALGVLRARLALRGAHLSLALLADSPPLLQRLDAGREALRMRLRDCGFEPELRIALLAPGDDTEA